VNAPTALEDHLRTTLQRRAAGPAPRGDAADVRRRAARRRRRRRAVPAVGAVAVIAAGLVAINRAEGTDRTATAAEGAGPQGPREYLPLDSSPLPLLVLDGAPTVRYFEMRYTGVTPTIVEPEYEFLVDGARLQLHLYPGGQPTFDLRVDDDGRTEVTVLDRDASLLDYGDGRYRVDVLVGDNVWEFDGEPFGSVDEFLAVVGRVRAVDQHAWDASVAEAERSELESDGLPGEPVPGEATAPVPAAK
jgi:hypothetical protein